MPGTLFVVATPIGNLEDVTFRALRTLREVDLIAAEDTRRTAKLLAHYEIRTPMVSLHEHNEFREAPRLVARLERGESIALVSDAGTPGIADPGARLVQAARAAGLTPVPIPGSSAITAALSVVGAIGTEFVFMGFPPPKGGERARWFERLRNERRTVVFFESPHRIVRTLEDSDRALADRPIDVLREITKINYELVKRPNNYGRAEPIDVGEFVLVVHAIGSPAISDESSAVSAELFGYMTDKLKCDASAAQQAVAIAMGIDLEDVDLAIRRGQKLAKRQKMTRR
jgi:16S rRNA (cytidine1402-2'-O)-methyltransferase